MDRVETLAVQFPKVARGSSVLMGALLALAIVTLDKARVLSEHAAEASRNSSGTMSALSGPYVSGTTITSATINARFADIENELTNSLDRSGRGGFLSSFRTIDSTVASPAWSFTNEPGSGYYRIGAGDLGLSILGTKTGEWTANGLRVANGTLANPSLSFFNDTGSGLYRIGTNDIGFAVNGVKITEWGAATAAFDVPAVTGATAARFGTTLRVGLTGTTGSGTGLGYNLTHNGTNWLYDTTNPAGIAVMESTGDMSWWTAPSGTAGAIASLTKRMIVNPSGVTIGSSGTAISKSLRGTSAAWSTGVMGTLTTASIAITLTGTVAGAECMVSGDSGYSALCPLTCRTTTDTCTAFTGNPTAGNLTCATTSTIACRVFNP